MCLELARFNIPQAACHVARTSDNLLVADKPAAGKVACMSGKLSAHSHGPLARLRQYNISRPLVCIQFKYVGTPRKRRKWVQCEPYGGGINNKMAAKQSGDVMTRRGGGDE